MKMIKLKVLRPFDFGASAQGVEREVGTEIERDIVTARYLLEHDEKNPLVDCVHQEDAKAIVKMIADEKAADAKAASDLEAKHEAERQKAKPPAPAPVPVATGDKAEAGQ